MLSLLKYSHTCSGYHCSASPDQPSVLISS